MQSAATIDRFRPPMVIRAFNRFGAMLNGKVSRRIPPEELIETAKRRANLDDFGDGDFREPLGHLLESCWRDARLNAIGSIALRSDVLRILRNRLLLQRDRSLHPEIAQHQIRAPLFVVGLPRTGTTFLHTLLSADPANRAPLTWEVMEPSPPTNAEKQRRIRRASQNLACLEWVAPNFGKLHPVGAELPQECVSLMSPSFLSDQFDTMSKCAGLSKMVFAAGSAAGLRISPTLSPTFAGTRKWAPLDSKSAYPYVWATDIARDLSGRAFPTNTPRSARSHHFCLQSDYDFATRV